MYLTAVVRVTARVTVYLNNHPLPSTPFGVETVSGNPACASLLKARLGRHLPLRPAEHDASLSTYVSLCR